MNVEGNFATKESWPTSANFFWAPAGAARYLFDLSESISMCSVQFVTAIIANLSIKSEARSMRAAQLARSRHFYAISILRKVAHFIPRSRPGKSQQNSQILCQPFLTLDEHCRFSRRHLNWCYRGILTLTDRAHDVRLQSLMLLKHHREALSGEFCRPLATMTVEDGEAAIVAGPSEMIFDHKLNKECKEGVS